jgi:hypothetical protein
VAARVETDDAEAGGEPPHLGAEVARAAAEAVPEDDGRPVTVDLHVQPGRVHRHAAILAAALPPRKAQSNSDIRCSVAPK